MTEQKNASKRYLLLIAFTSGLTIMAIEICASRLLAPYFGTSTFVWTNIIGVIMVALALGYYLGGKLADKQPKFKILLQTIIIACIFLLVIPFLMKPLVEMVMGNIVIWHSASTLIFLGSLLSASLLFIFPILLLGATSPFIIKLLSTLNKEQIGNDAGLVFSISTVGSILGTFLPVLIFIPLWGTRKTVIFFSLLLLLVALAGFLKNKLFLFLLLLVMPALIFKMPAIKSVKAVYEDESVYQYFQVVDKNDLRYLRINEGLGVFSMLNKSGSVLTGEYFDYYNILPYLDGNGKNQDILILGLAGGTISTELNHFFGQNYNLKIDGVELDKKLITTADKYFSLENPSLTVYNSDGRNFLSLTAKKYNAIVVDVYANQLYIPFHMATKEFFQAVKNHLADKGVVAINVNATAPDSKLLKNFINTLLLVFKNVYCTQETQTSWNYMVIASDFDLDFSNLESLFKNSELVSVVFKAFINEKQMSYDQNFGYLTDDKAPIENLTDWMILDYVFKSR